MKKILSTFCVAALVAGPALASDLPTNNTITGGQGDVQLDGQLAVGAAFGGLGTITAIAVVAVGVLAVTVLNEETGTTTTTTVAGSI